MQIGVLEIQRHHPSTLVKTLQNRSEGLHAELGDMKISVESTEVEKGIEFISVLGTQEIMGVNIPSPLVTRQIDHFNGPLG